MPILRHSQRNARCQFTAAVCKQFTSAKCDWFLGTEDAKTKREELEK
jgi:hypothetical protein